MRTGGLGQYIDVAQMTLYAFWAFFAGLVFYLRREDKREGYPLVSEMIGESDKAVTEGFPLLPRPKMFRLYHGGVSYAPRPETPTIPNGAVSAGLFPGAPLDPTGNPLVDGIGPAAYAHRLDEPDLTIDGKYKIVPLREGREYYLHPASPDPRGWRVVAADRLSPGVISDIWLDEIEEAVRYLEITLTLPGFEGQHVLIPHSFVRFRKNMREVSVTAILSYQFADAPRTRSLEYVTRFEEDKLVGYFGGGQLLATYERSRPLL
ncbi:MAG: photosynthetic reaction center subunit H [Proteobacteria bacterium]|nr:photosynthetic reaction center subunit H [Pseudomonadota bacterium]